jgi:hypothetical protein
MRKQLKNGFLLFITIVFNVHAMTDSGIIEPSPGLPAQSISQGERDWALTGDLDLYNTGGFSYRTCSQVKKLTMTPPTTQPSKIEEISIFGFWHYNVDIRDYQSYLTRISVKFRETVPLHLTKELESRELMGTTSDNVITAFSERCSPQFLEVLVKHGLISDRVKRIILEKIKYSEYYS